jgi:helicase
VRLDALSRYGLPGQIIKRWALDGIRFLLPIQSESVSRYGLLDGKSLIISGPGTSGKTFCGELAVASKAAARQKGIFIEPLKAVAEEKYRTFVGRYKPLGIAVKLATRDNALHDKEIYHSKFDIGIFIYEKFNSLTSTDISIIKSVSCFVLDEFQMISDPKRGIEFELAIMKIRAFNPTAQIVILLGGGASPEKIASWLGLPLLEENRRPVDLRLGVLHRGTFHFRGFNDLNEGDERWLQQIDPDESDLLSGQNMAAIKYLIGEGEQILIFTCSKKSAVGLAEYLASHLNLPEAGDSLNSIAECPPSLQNETLERCLRHGIAFHHAELDEYQRQLIEDGFRRGEIRLLTSTSTLATGVNLPAKNVFIESVKYAGVRSEHTRELITPLSGVDFHQAAGRAGRLGCEKSFGRAIMTANTQFEQEVLWDKYIYGQIEDPLPGLSVEQLPELILRGISCGAAAKPDEMEMICRKTYAGSRNALGDDLHAKLNDILLYLEKGGLIRIKAWGQIEATRFGKAAGGAGLSVKSSIEIREWLSSPGSPAPLESLLLAVRLTEWSSEATGYHLGNISPHILMMRIQEALGGDTVYLTPDLFRALQDYLDLGLKQSLGAFLFAVEWCSGRPTREMEAFFQKGAGGLKRDSSTLCWILRAIDRIARAAGPSTRNEKEAIPDLGNLIERLHYGIEERMLPLAKEIGLDREFIRRLYENGIISPDHLYQTDLSALRSLLPESSIKKIERWRQNYIHKNENNVPTESPRNEPLIKFTGNSDKLKNEVIIDGRSIFLQERLYLYLQKIWWGYIGDNRWVHKDTLDAGPNQAKYISRLRRILRENGVEIEIISNGRGAYALRMPDGAMSAKNKTPPVENI